MHLSSHPEPGRDGPFRTNLTSESQEMLSKHAEALVVQYEILRSRVTKVAMFNQVTVEINRTMCRALLKITGPKVLGVNDMESAEQLLTQASNQQLDKMSKDLVSAVDGIKRGVGENLAAAERAPAGALEDTAQGSDLKQDFLTGLNLLETSALSSASDMKKRCTDVGKTVEEMLELIKYDLEVEGLTGGPSGKLDELAEAGQALVDLKRIFNIMVRSEMLLVLQEPSSVIIRQLDEAQKAADILFLDQNHIFPSTIRRRLEELRRQFE